MKQLRLLCLALVLSTVGVRAAASSPEPPAPACKDCSNWTSPRALSCFTKDFCQPKNACEACSKAWCEGKLGHALECGQASARERSSEPPRAAGAAGTPTRTDPDTVKTRTAAPGGGPPSSRTAGPPPDLEGRVRERTVGPDAQPAAVVAPVIAPAAGAGSGQSVDSETEHIMELLGQGEFAKAESASRSLVAHNPREPQAWFTLGSIQLERSKWTEAIETFRKAVELDPEEPFFRALLARAFVRAGNREEALREARRALAMGMPAEADPIFKELGLP